MKERLSHRPKILHFSLTFLILRVLLFPSFVFFYLVELKQDSWLESLVISGMQPELASTNYTKIPFDFQTLILTIVWIIAFPVVIGQLSLAGEIMEIRKKSKYFASKKRLKRNVRTKAKNFEANRISKLFFGLYIPSKSVHFKFWYLQSAAAQIVYFFIVSISCSILSITMPTVILFNFAREYSFTLLMVASTFLIICKLKQDLSSSLGGATN